MLLSSLGLGLSYELGLKLGPGLRLECCSKRLGKFERLLLGFGESVMGFCEPVFLVRSAKPLLFNQSCKVFVFLLSRRLHSTPRLFETVVDASQYLCIEQMVMVERPCSVTTACKVSVSFNRAGEILKNSIKECSGICGLDY